MPVKFAKDDAASAESSCEDPETTSKPIKDEVKDEVREAVGKSMRQFQLTPKAVRRKRRLRRADIGEPQDFAHVAHVAPRPIIKVDFNDPDIKHFLLQAGVTDAQLARPEIYETVAIFIHSHGVERLRNEVHLGEPPVTPVDPGNSSRTETTEPSDVTPEQTATDPAQLAGDTTPDVLTNVVPFNVESGHVTGAEKERRSSSSSGDSSEAQVEQQHSTDVTEGSLLAGPETKGALPRKLALWLQPKRKRQNIETAPKTKKVKESPPKENKKPKESKENKKPKEETTPKNKKFFLKPKPEKSKLEMEQPKQKIATSETSPKTKRSYGIKRMFTRKRNSLKVKQNVEQDVESIRNETLPKQFDFPIENTNFQESNCTIEQTEEIVTVSSEVIQEIPHVDEVELRPVRSLTRQSRLSIKSNSETGLLKRVSRKSSSSSSNDSVFHSVPDTAIVDKGQNSELPPSFAEKYESIVLNHYEEITISSSEYQTNVTEIQKMRKSWSNVMSELKKCLTNDEETIEILPSGVKNQDIQQTTNNDHENDTIYSELKFIDKKLKKSLLVVEDSESIISTSNSTNTAGEVSDGEILSPMTSQKDQKDQQEETSDQSDADSDNSEDTDNSPIPLDTSEDEKSSIVSSRSASSQSTSDINVITTEVDTSVQEVETSMQTNDDDDQNYSTSDSSRESNSIKTSTPAIENSQENNTTETSVIAYRENNSNLKILYKTNSDPTQRNYQCYSECKPLPSSPLVVQQISLDDDSDEDYGPSGSYSFENLQDIDILAKNASGKRPRQLKRGTKIESQSPSPNLSPINSPSYEWKETIQNSVTHLTHEQTVEQNTVTSEFFIDITSLPTSPISGSPIVQNTSNCFPQPPPSIMARKMCRTSSADGLKTPHRMAPSPPPTPRKTTILVQTSGSSKRPASQPVATKEEFHYTEDQDVEMRFRKSDLTDYESLHMQGERRVSVERNASYHRAIETERSKSLEAAASRVQANRGGSGSRTSSRIPRPILKTTMRHSADFTLPTHRVTEL